ncbi:antibiotic biosynthesis monooxygenase [Cupriavidus necator]|uniref:Antibiotic biosynthesis monooxygenase n=1 Tax=Cupriavidus necator TaxID=106590 RepID=A0A1U9V0S2_CUPNE|nr:antibiotic biosynthesis monooxygenase [Cupriavidus necator]AQV98568.1 antibiotic biosynthesis monooxygenase [Cupriavidus necator]
MYIAAFIYRPGQADDAFHRLSALIDEIAAGMPGFVGAESWRSPDGQLFNASYYWRDKESLQAFATHPRHLDAKRQYRKWYDGYHVVISEVQRAYGDGSLQHFVPDSRRQPRE